MSCQRRDREAEHTCRGRSEKQAQLSEYPRLLLRLKCRTEFLLGNMCEDRLSPVRSYSVRKLPRNPNDQGNGRPASHSDVCRDSRCKSSPRLHLQLDQCLSGRKECCNCDFSYNRCYCIFASFQYHGKQRSRISLSSPYMQDDNPRDEGETQATSSQDVQMSKRTQHWDPVSARKDVSLPFSPRLAEHLASCSGGDRRKGLLGVEGRK
ncbi:hypothetical protein BDP67DRAFT_45706 [Colletotrichum lupini]|nr:hypothetical protein BDP67DRAFT_45706 [Colletotrichum lupini]